MHIKPGSIEADLASTREFCADLETSLHSVNSLSDINSSVQKASLKLKDHPFLAKIRDKAMVSLGDPEVGIVAIDIPSGLNDDRNRDALLGSMVATAIVSSISLTVPDHRNETPFTLYNASVENEEQLKAAGVRYYSPEDRLGFHTDGLVRDGEVLVPNFISIYNLLIAYRNPGNFYFLPFALWDEYEIFSKKLGIGREYRFSMTPIVYADRDGKIEAAAGRFLNSPIFFRTECNSSLMFFNGEVDEDDPELCKAINLMKSSMLDNTRRISIPFQNRRLFVMANKKGLHARVVFADPIPNVKFTRSFLRYVSADGECVSKISGDEPRPQELS